MLQCLVLEWKLPDEILWMELKLIVGIKINYGLQVEKLSNRVLGTVDCACKLIESNLKTSVPSFVAVYRKGYKCAYELLQMHFYTTDEGVL